MNDRLDAPSGFRRASGPRGTGGRFLVVRLSALGDVLHALPAVAALRVARPEARIEWLVEDRFAAILEGHPAIDRVRVVPRTRWRRDLRRPWKWPGLVLDAVRFVGGLWGGRFDAAIDLQGNAKSGLWSLLSGAPARFGFASGDVREGNGLLTNRHVRVPAGAVHRVDRALALVGAAVGRAALPYVTAPIARSGDERERVDRMLSDAGAPMRGFAVLHPGSSGFGSFKRWPPERFGELARRLGAEGTRCVVTVGPGEAELGAEVLAAARGSAVVLAPPDLRSLAELVSRASVFVSADTGPLHVAAAEGVAVVALFGPKDAAIYGPYRPPVGGRAAGVGCVVTSTGVGCRPCVLRRCPDPVCMTSIDVAVVADRVRQIVASA